MSEWQPIETAPPFPFVKETWFKNSPSVLVWNGGFCEIASYGYTERGKGRWQGYLGNIKPTHWMPLPESPK